MGTHLVFQFQVRSSKFFIFQLQSVLVRVVQRVLPEGVRQVRPHPQIHLRKRVSGEAVRGS